MLEHLIDQIIRSYKADPRNKLYVDEAALLAGAIEETGNAVSRAKLRVVIEKYKLGELSDEEQEIYDGAVYACCVAANNCFSDDPDASVDYEIDWLENDDGSFTAEVRPN